MWLTCFYIDTRPTGHESFAPWLIQFFVIQTKGSKSKFESNYSPLDSPWFIFIFFMSLMSLLFFHHQTPTKTKPLTALMIKVRFSRGTCQASLHRADVVVDLKGLVVKISVLWCVEIWGHPSSQASQVLLKEMSRLKMVDKLYSLSWFAEMESGPRFLSNIFNHEVRGFSILPSCLDSLYKNGTHFVRGCFWTLIELGWTYFLNVSSH